MQQAPAARAQFTFAQFMNARSAHTPTFTPDSRSVAFLADIAGVPQIWRVPLESGWPEQLTFEPERVMSAQYAHHSPTLIYGVDTGGNELEQLYSLERGLVRDVAIDPIAMHTYGALSPDDSHLAYSDNSRNPAYFDVYTCRLDGSERRRVYEQDGSNFVTDWSADGRYLLLSRRNGPMDGDLFLLHLSSGEAVHLTPHEGSTLFEQGAFSPDGTKIYLVTDRDSEFSRAARLAVDSQELTFLTGDNADVDEVELSPDGRTLAILRNVDSYSVLSLLDLDRIEERPMDGLPRGVAQQLTWSPDGRYLAFALTSPDMNMNVWLWDGQLHDFRQLTFVTNGGIPQEVLAQPEIIHYRSFDDLEIPALLYLPEEEHPPVVVLVHGGPESQSRPIYNPTVQYLVNRGYAVLLPNVRGSTGYGRTYTHLDDLEKRMDSVADLKAAADWLRSSGRIDPDRIAVMGGSYGGFMVLAALTTYPEVWTAGVDIVGIANFETFLRNTSAYRRQWRIPEYGDPDIHAGLFARISPIHHVERIEAPLMVIHGDNDPRVPLGEAQQMVDALERRGRPVEFLRFPDEGHGIIKLKNKLVAYPAIGAFLDRYLQTG